jgi:hypothetical protein
VGGEEDDHEERHGIQDARARGWLRLLLRHRRRRRRWGEVAGDGVIFRLALFSSENFVVFDKYCQIMHYLGSKDSSRQFRPNCAISFYFRLYLMLHACV